MCLNAKVNSDPRDGVAFYPHLILMKGSCIFKSVSVNDYMTVKLIYLKIATLHRGT